MLKWRNAVAVVDSHIQRIVLAKTNESAIELSNNVNPARGRKEVRSPTDHIMVITRYLNQQGSKSRQNSYQVQPPGNIGNLSASTQVRRLWVQTIQFLLSGVRPVFQKLTHKIYGEECLMMCCPCTAHPPKNEVIKNLVSICTKYDTSTFPCSRLFNT